MSRVKLSIIIPALNEAEGIADTLLPLQTCRNGDLELIVVDGGSDDNTISEADPLCDRVLSARRGRACQMNVGWQAASGRLVWFLHADAVASRAHVDCLLAIEPKSVWGRFDIRLDHPRSSYRLIETLINLRSSLSGIATGDQGIFVSRDLLETVGGYPEIPLMEDVALSRLLKRYRRPRRLRLPLGASARRWENGGVWRTVLLMWRLRLAYALGQEPEQLARSYRDAR